MTKAEIEQAKKRRAKLLKEFNASLLNKSDFAAKHGITRQRMGQLLKKAMEELRCTAK